VRAAARRRKCLLSPGKSNHRCRRSYLIFHLDSNKQPFFSGENLGFVWIWNSEKSWRQRFNARHSRSYTHSGTRIHTDIIPWITLTFTHIRCSVSQYCRYTHCREKSTRAEMRERERIMRCFTLHMCTSADSTCVCVCVKVVCVCVCDLRDVHPLPRL